VVFQLAVLNLVDLQVLHLHRHRQLVLNEIIFFLNLFIIQISYWKKEVQQQQHHHHLSFHQEVWNHHQRVAL
jgi:hypothetical protein